MNLQVLSDDRNISAPSLQSSHEATARLYESDALSRPRHSSGDYTAVPGIGIGIGSSCQTNAGLPSGYLAQSAQRLANNGSVNLPYLIRGGDGPRFGSHLGTNQYARPKTTSVRNRVNHNNTIAKYQNDQKRRKLQQPIANPCLASPNDVGMTFLPTSAVLGPGQHLTEFQLPYTSSQNLNGIWDTLNTSLWQVTSPNLPINEARPVFPVDLSFGDGAVYSFICTDDATNSLCKPRPKLQTRALVLWRLLTAFAKSRGAVRPYEYGIGPVRKHANGESSRASQASTQQSSQQSDKGKQKRTGRGGIDNRDGGGNGRKKRSPKTITGPETKETTRSFACPFYKSDPVRYKCCRDAKFYQIHRLKTHLQRRHEDPIHCTVCGKDSQPRQGQFMCRVGCLNGLQKERLRRRIDQTKSQHDQWNDVFQICCPGEDLPADHYISDRLVAPNLSVIQDHLIKQLPHQYDEFIASYGLPAELTGLGAAVQAHVMNFLQTAVPHTMQSFEQPNGNNEGSPTDSGITNTGTDSKLWEEDWSDLIVYPEIGFLEPCDVSHHWTGSTAAPSISNDAPYFSQQTVVSVPHNEEYIEALNLLPTAVGTTVRSPSDPDAMEDILQID